MELDDQIVAIRRASFNNNNWREKQMRFAMFHSQFWNSKRVRSLESDERVCLIYLMTCQHGNSAACMRLPAAYAAADLGWEAERYIRALERLADQKLVVADPETEEVFVTGWFRWNPPNGPKAEEGAKRLIAVLESDSVREAAEVEMAEARQKAKTAPKNRVREPSF